MKSFLNSTPLSKITFVGRGYRLSHVWSKSCDIRALDLSSNVCGVSSFSFLSVSLADSSVFEIECLFVFCRLVLFVFLLTCVVCNSFGMVGISFISNHPVAVSMNVIAHNVSSTNFVVPSNCLCCTVILYGPMRSTATSYHG